MGARSADSKTIHISLLHQTTEHLWTPKREMEHGLGVSVSSAVPRCSVPSRILGLNT